jgi:heme/copper-type cytochrome/quinol oxidase subunit 3
VSRVLSEDRPLPVGSKSSHASGWWGMLALIATEASVFAYLLFSYYYLAAHSNPPWPDGGPPDLKLAVPGTLILIAGSVVMYWGEHGIREGRRGRLTAALIISVLLAAVFLALELWEWFHKSFSLTSSAYSSVYYVTTGFHMAHLVAGALMLLVLLVWNLLGYFTPQRHSGVSVTGLYWHFVTVVWLFLFFTFYISPRLG